MCGSVHYISIGDRRLSTVAEANGLWDAESIIFNRGISVSSWTFTGRYFITLNGQLNGHPPSKLLLQAISTIARNQYVYCFCHFQLLVFLPHVVLLLSTQFSFRLHCDVLSVPTSVELASVVLYSKTDGN